MPVSPATVQKLREKTGAGFMDCKRALEEAGSDLEKAIQVLREKGKASAAQKTLRAASQGVIGSWISPDFKKGSLIELNCETDFVARTAEFLELAKTLARLAGEESVSSVEELLTKKYEKSGETVEAAIKEKVAKLGENILLRKAVSLGGANLSVGNYIHSPMQHAPECGSIGVLVGMELPSLSPGMNSVLRELAMQIAASSPKWVLPSDVPASVIEREMEIYKGQCRASGKPEKAWEKIMQGKLNDFYKQFCLLEQSYIREPKMTVQSYLQSSLAKEGVDNSKTPVISKFFRFKVGEE